MKVIDNFLDKESFEKIKNGIVNNSYFPWYFSEYTDYLNEEGLEKSKYVHAFYHQNKPNSQHYDLLLPFLEKLKCNSLIRIKINSTSYSTKLIEGTYHTDVKFIPYPVTWLRQERWETVTKEAKNTNLNRLAG